MAQGDPHDKVTPELGEAADKAAGLLDVIVELEPPEERTHSMDTARAAFERDAEPVIATISKMGGEVTDGVWLNRTLRAKVPPRGLAELSDHASISALDVPHAIKPE
jgi:hypothetical protein